MTKRLIDAAQATVDSLIYGHHRHELQAALSEARQPVTVKRQEGLAVEKVCAMAVESLDPENYEALVQALKQLCKNRSIKLQKARELGL